MPEPPDFFRDHGIIPYGVPPPAGTVRAYLPWWHIVGQYLFTAVLLAFGLGIGLLFALTLPRPLNVAAAAAALAGVAALIYLATRNDYAWIELDGDTLRAQHLYTRRIIERPVEEIDDLLTLVLQIRTAETAIVNAWLGRVRGIEIRFRDRRTPLRVSRTDPAMKNARELIEAVIYRMSEADELDAEIIPFQGKPLIRRIHWKGEPG
jgi:hypothetical protein